MHTRNTKATGLSHRQKALINTVCAVALLAAPAAPQAVTLFGTLSNFDVVNDTGQEAYGFEIELDGISGVGYSFSANRYGTPRNIPFSGGVYVRYGANWDAVQHRWVQANQNPAQLVGAGPATVVDTNITPTAGHQCVYWLPNYATSGCDHFGLVLPYYSPQPTQVVYRWLWANPDPAHAGEFVYAGSNVAPASPTAAAPIPPPPPPSAPVVLIPQPVFAVQPAQPVRPRGRTVSAVEVRAGGSHNPRSRR